MSFYLKESQCPKSWVKAGSKCFKGFPRKLNWKPQLCKDKAEGSVLATIGSSEENDAAWKAMKNAKGKQKEV